MSEFIRALLRESQQRSEAEDSQITGKQKRAVANMLKTLNESAKETFAGEQFSNRDHDQVLYK